MAPVISSQQHNQITPSNSVESNIGGFGIQSGKTSQQLIQHLDPGSHPSIKSEDQSPNPVVVDNLTGARLRIFFYWDKPRRSTHFQKVPDHKNVPVQLLINQT